MKMMNTMMTGKKKRKSERKKKKEEDSLSKKYRFRVLNYPGANCILFCFEVSNRSSFKSIFATWIPEVFCFKILKNLHFFFPSLLRSFFSPNFTTLWLDEFWSEQKVIIVSVKQKKENNLSQLRKQPNLQKKIRCNISNVLP